MNQLLGMCGLHVAAERAVVSKSTKVIMKMTEGDSPSNGALLAVLMALSSILRSENHPPKKQKRGKEIFTLRIRALSPLEPSLCSQRRVRTRWTWSSLRQSIDTWTRIAYA